MILSVKRHVLDKIILLRFLASNEREIEFIDALHRIPPRLRHPMSRCPAFP